MEKKIAALWLDILNLDTVGIHDNFFDLGGNSLSIIDLSSDLKEAVGSEVPVVKLFDHPTIHTQAEYLSPGDESEREVRSERKTRESVNRMKQSVNRFKRK
ncbi:MAG: hypothetical protein GY940_35795 [bacterium]|nr:hypothetical protein [bacterium]